MPSKGERATKTPNIIYLYYTKMVGKTWSGIGEEVAGLENMSCPLGSLFEKTCDKGNKATKQRCLLEGVVSNESLSSFPYSIVCVTQIYK